MNSLNQSDAIDSDSNGEKKPHELQLKPSDKRFERKILTLVVINFRTVCFFPRSFPIFCPRYGQTRFSHHTRSLSIPYNFSFGNIFFIHSVLFVYISSTQTKLWESLMRRRAEKKISEKKQHTKIIHQNRYLFVNSSNYCGVFFLYTRSFFSWLLCMLFMFCST